MPVVRLKAQACDGLAIDSARTDLPVAVQSESNSPADGHHVPGPGPRAGLRPPIHPDSDMMPESGTVTVRLGTGLSYYHDYGSRYAVTRGPGPPTASHCQCSTLRAAAAGDRDGTVTVGQLQTGRT